MCSRWAGIIRASAWPACIHRLAPSMRVIELKFMSCRMWWSRCSGGRTPHERAVKSCGDTAINRACLSGAEYTQEGRARALPRCGTPASNSAYLLRAVAFVVRHHLLRTNLWVLQAHHQHLAVGKQHIPPAAVCQQAQAARTRQHSRTTAQTPGGDDLWVWVWEISLNRQRVATVAGLNVWRKAPAWKFNMACV
jgi:hypothetical protein